MLLLPVSCAAPAPAPTFQPAPPGPPRPPPPGVTYIYPEESSTSSAPAPRPALTSAEQAYITTITKQATTVADTLTKLGQLFQNPQIDNEDWLLTTALGLTIIRTAYNNAMEIEPPDSMTHLHYKYVEGMKHLNTSTELIVQGLDEMNPNLLEKASIEIETGGHLLAEAMELMLKFKETHK